MWARPGVCFTQAVTHSIHNKAGIRRDNKMCSRDLDNNEDSHLWEWDGSGTELRGSGTGTGQRRERAGVGLNN